MAEGHLLRTPITDEENEQRIKRISNTITQRYTHTHKHILSHTFVVSCLAVVVAFEVVPRLKPKGINLW